MSTPGADGQPGFAGALARAIDRSGLTLAQVSERLAARGHRLSTASLSFWRNGQRRPTRRSSQPVIEALETVLGLPPGALTNTVPGWAPAQRHPLAGLPDQPRLAEALDDLGTSLAWQPWPHVVRTHVTVNGGQRWTAVGQTLVLRAPRHDTVAVPLLLPVPHGTRATLAGHRGGRLGDPVVLDDLPDEPALLVMRAELANPLRRGQLVAIEYQLDVTGAGDAWVACAIAARTSLLSLQATFVDTPPARVWCTSSPDASGSTSDATADVVPGRDVQHTAADVPAGCHTLRWSAQSPPTR